MMKTRSIPLKTLTLLFALIAPQFLRAQVTVSGHVTLPSGTTPSNAKICFSLQNFKPNVPRVVGAGIIVQTASWCINPAANGSYSASLWGNDVISPPGTYWRVDFLLNGVQQSSASYTINSSCTNLDTCTPLVLPPSGASNIIGAKTFVFKQASSATTWNINHNFGNRSVEVQCYDPNGNLLSPSNIVLTDNNNTTVTFGSPQTGSCSVMKAGNVALTNTLANAVVTNPTTPQTLNTQPTLFQGPVTVLSASVLASINNVCKADQQAGADWIGQVRACISAAPASGVLVDATGYSSTTLDATPNSTGNPFNTTKPFIILFGPSTFKYAKTLITNNSNQYFACQPGGSLDFEPSGTINTANLNDRAIEFAAVGISGNLNRPISNAINIGDTSFTVTNGSADTSDLQPGEWIQVHESDANISDLTYFDWAQVSSVSGGGSTVNVRFPFRMAFPNNHTPKTLSFDRFPLNAGVAENVGISGCTVMSNQSAVNTPGIDVHFGVRNAWVTNNVIKMANGQNLYSYRTSGVHFLNNKIKLLAGTGLEMAESTDWDISGNVFSHEDGTTSIASAAALVDFGAAFGTFTNNKVTNTVGTGENAFGFWFGVHSVQIVGNEVGYQSGTGVAAFLGQGAFNNVVMRNRALGGGNRTGIKFITSTALAQNIASTGNLITGNRMSAY